MYGGLIDLLQSYRKSTRKSRALLKELFECITAGDITKGVILCHLIDKELLDGLDSYCENEDKIGIDGKPAVPEWLVEENLRNPTGQ